jgi:hypothetical protein
MRAGPARHRLGCIAIAKLVLVPRCQLNSKLVEKHLAFPSQTYNVYT